MRLFSKVSCISLICIAAALKSLSMSCPKLALALFCITSALNSSNSARILGLFPIHSKSHLIIHSAIAEALAERGHNVTVVSNHSPIKEFLPYHYVELKVPLFAEKAISEAVKIRKSWFTTVMNFLSASTKLSNTTLNHPLMQKLMAEESFDLVLLGYFWNDFMFGVAAHFKCPLVLSYTVRPFVDINDLVGNPQEYAYVPTMGKNGMQPIFFVDRVKNFVKFTVPYELIVRYIMRWKQNMFYKANFPSDKYPSLDTMMKNVSLVMTAHHFSQFPIRPDVPAMVEIGGIHIKNKTDPLPKDLQDIMDNSTENGVIYFSLGTNICRNYLDASKVKAIFAVLSKLPQTILCKWNDPELPSKSPNIIYKKWLPQEDILRHPNLKLFISHGGLGGVTEAEYHGVPMVGIPLINDQFSNVENFENAGFGLGVNYATLTEESLDKAVKEVLSNKSYTENVKRFSKIYRDRPLSPRETAVYWVEYVLRHHGARHLQSPAIYMNSFQLLSLDVIAFLVAITYAIYVVLKLIFKLIEIRKSKMYKLKGE